MMTSIAGDRVGHPQTDARHSDEMITLGTLAFEVFDREVLLPATTGKERPGAQSAQSPRRVRGQDRDDRSHHPKNRKRSRGAAEPPRLAPRTNPDRHRSGRKTEESKLAIESDDAVGQGWGCCGHVASFTSREVGPKGILDTDPFQLANPSV